MDDVSVRHTFRIQKERIGQLEDQIASFEDKLKGNEELTKELKTWFEEKLSQQNMEIGRLEQRFDLKIKDLEEKMAIKNMRIEQLETDLKKIKVSKVAEEEEESILADLSHRLAKLEESSCFFEIQLKEVQQAKVDPLLQKIEHNSMKSELQVLKLQESIRDALSDLGQRTTHIEGRVLQNFNNTVICEICGRKCSKIGLTRHRKDSHGIVGFFA